MSKKKQVKSAGSDIKSEPAVVNKGVAASSKVAKQINALLGRSKTTPRDGISTGSKFLNFLLTGNMDIGYPYGAVIEAMGENGAGKSTLAAHGVREAQLAGMAQHWTDAETTLDGQWSYFERIGVDMDNLPHTDSEDPPVMETALKDVMQALELGAFCVVDSVPALQPKKQEGRELGGGFQTARAALLSEALPIMRPLARRGKGILLFVNQLRVDMGSGQEKGAGGKALPYYSDIRLKLFAWVMNTIKGTQSLADIESSAVVAKHGDTKMGVTVVCDILKNRFHAPHKRAKLDIIYGKGIDRKKDIVYLGEYCGVVTDVTTKQCKYNGKQYMVENMSEDMLGEIIERSRKVRFA